MKRAGLAVSTLLVLSALVMSSAPAAAQRLGRTSGGGRLGAQSGMSQSYGRTSTSGSTLNSSAASGTQQRSCQAGSQTGLSQTGGMMGAQSGGMRNSQMGGSGQQSNSSGGTTQLTVSPVRTSAELTQLLKVVQGSASGASFQVKPNGDGQSATVSVGSSTNTSSTTLAQTLQSSGFQILEVSVQGSGRSSGMGMQGQQQAATNSYQGMTTNRAQYGQAASMAAQYTAALQARNIQQYRAAVQGRSR